MCIIPETTISIVGSDYTLSETGYSWIRKAFDMDISYMIVNIG